MLNSILVMIDSKFIQEKSTKHSNEIICTILLYYIVFKIL